MPDEKIRLRGNLTILLRELNYQVVWVGRFHRRVTGLSAVLHLQAFATAFNRAEWSDKTFTDSTCVKSILQFIPFPLFVERKREKRKKKKDKDKDSICEINFISYKYQWVSFFYFLSLRWNWKLEIKYFSIYIRYISR